jgi:hypothetical protein
MVISTLSGVLARLFPGAIMGGAMDHVALPRLWSWRQWFTLNSCTFFTGIAAARPDDFVFTRNRSGCSWFVNSHGAILSDLDHFVSWRCGVRRICRFWDLHPRPIQALHLASFDEGDAASESSHLFHACDPLGESFDNFPDFVPKSVGQDVNQDRPQK